MAGKHLATGSSDPPLLPGKLRLYSMRFCPYAHRVHLVLLAKNVPFDPVYINLKTKPEWYPEKIPGGKVPAIVVDGENLYESLIISDFLDEQYSQRPLHSKTTLQKAKDRILIESFGKVTGSIYKVKTSASATLEDFEVVLEELVAFDTELSRRGTGFYGGDKPGMVDYMIWPWFERLQALKYLHGDQFVLPETRFPNLTKWVEVMKTDEAVQGFYLSPEIHAKFIKTHHAGNPDFDMPTHP